MKLTIDTEARTLTLEEADGARVLPLYSKEAFQHISREWVRVGWNEKYAYTFSWMGRPIIQLPEDLIRVQEVIWATRPEVIIETGVAHGGSLVFYAGLLEALGRGRVVGVDIEIRPPNRAAIEAHPLAGRIELIEGDSVAPDVLARVGTAVGDARAVMVLLDSNHTRAHVAAELEAYREFVTPGCWLVATDGIMRDLADVPRGEPGWATDHPTAAAEAFAATHPEFVHEAPPWSFNESALTENVTHWPGAWLRRR